MKDHALGIVIAIMTNIIMLIVVNYTHIVLLPKEWKCSSHYLEFKGDTSKEVCDQYTRLSRNE